MKTALGDLDGGLAAIEQSVRLSPIDPQLYSAHVCAAMAHFFAGRYEEAASRAAHAVSEQPKFAGGHRFLAASLAMSGRIEEARRAIQELARMAPSVRLSNAANWIIPYRPPEYAPRLLEALRLAGLPE